MYTHAAKVSGSSLVQAQFPVCRPVPKPQCYDSPLFHRCTSQRTVQLSPPRRLIPTVNGSTVRSFSTHGHQSAANGSSTTVSRSDIRLIQHLDSSALWSDGPEVALNWPFPYPKYPSPGVACFSARGRGGGGGRCAAAAGGDGGGGGRCEKREKEKERVGLTRGGGNALAFYESNREFKMNTGAYPMILVYAGGTFWA
jgi:hypothetical protein